MTSEANHDLLLHRLEQLDLEDLVAILAAGLRLPQTTLQRMQHGELVLLGSEKLRASAGSSLRNLARDSHEFPYKQLLIDVADKMSPGITPLSWTRYRLNDGHPEQEIELHILTLFEAQARRWWNTLPDQKKQHFVDGINSLLRGEQDVIDSLAKGPVPFLQQQAIEQIFQSGLIAGLTKVSASGALGVVGISVVGQLGWLILLQTVGWMTGLKIAIFGIGGYGAAGGAVSWLGGAAIGSAVALPGVVALIDGPAYRKTVPTTIMLLAKTRIDMLAGSHNESGR